MGKEIIRPIKGIDVDSSYNRREDNSIYMAKNMRLNSSEDTNLGEYTNINGTNIAINPPTYYEIRKISKVNDNIIVFLSSSYVGVDAICLVKEEDIPLNPSSPITLSMINYYWNGTPNQYHKIISGNFGFYNTDLGEYVDIDVKTYYESDTVQKVYWNIVGQPSRVLNVIYSTKNDPSDFTEELMAFVPQAELSRPVINKTISGNLSCGKIYYGYKLVNTIGLETNLSELSNPYHLTTSQNTNANDFGYVGGGIDLNSNKGINLTISNIDFNFNRIKVYSIHYIDDVSLPVIKLIYDNYAASSLSINDIGNAILLIAPEEFIKSSLDSTGGLFEIKNNRMFISNYTEEYFDIDTDSVKGFYWDSRAYRFNSVAEGATAKLYHGNGALMYEINGSTPGYNAYEDVLEDADCINNSNNRDDATITYKYCSDGATLGAEGMNILISQTYNKFVHPDIANSNIISYAEKTTTNYSPTSGYSSYANPKNDSAYKSFKPEEVYRIAIQFRNAKGQYSYPKWICDYRYIYNETYSTTLVNTASLKMFIQSLSVTASNIPTDPATGAAYEYRILYVPITEEQEGVYWGMFTELYKVTSTGLDVTDKFIVEYLRNNDTVYEGTPSLTASDYGKYLEFVCPDYCFGIKKSYTNIRLLKYCAQPQIITTKPNIGTSYSLLKTKQTALNKVYNLSNVPLFDSMFYTANGQYDIEYDSNIEEVINLDDGDSFIRIGVGRRYLSSEDRSKRGGANKGRCQILKPSTAINSSTRPVYWGCVYIDDYLSKYGGISYEARQNNGYVPLTEFVTIPPNTASATVSVYGDCYLGSFEYLRQISENNSDWVKEDWTTRASIPDVVYFPVISRINVNLRSDTTYSQIYKTDGSYLIHEYAGVQEDTSDYNNANWILTQETDLYLYNQSYSRPNDLFMYYPKQTLSSAQESFKLRINVSDKKIIGELTDSFTKISPNNYIDVDGQYGEVITLKVFNDKLFFFQKNAIGIVSTNERALTSIQDGSQLSMGVVNLLERYDYLTIKNGISNKNHIGVSNSSIYVIDDVRKQLLKIDNGIEKISITKNVDSYVRFKDWHDGIVIYNRKYNEVLFLHEDPDNANYHIALVYNEIQQQFVAIYTYKTKLTDVIEINRTDLYDELVIGGGHLLTLNDGNFNEFLSTYTPSEITFLFSTQNEDQVLYNVIEFIAYQQDVNGNTQDFIDTIEIYTKTQSTGELPFSANTAFKFNKYRTNKLRNLSDGKRMLSDHLYVTIKTLPNTNTNYRIFVRDMIATFFEYKEFFGI